MLLRVVDAAVSREAMAAIMETSSQNSTVVLVGSSAGGIGAMNVASWLLDSFEQVRLRRIRHGKVGVELCARILLLLHPCCKAQSSLNSATMAMRRSSTIPLPPVTLRLRS